MNISSISGIGGIDPINRLTPNLEPVSRTPDVKGQNAFDEALNAALVMFDETNSLQKQADNTQLDFASGKTDDILAVMMAEQKAYTSMDFTVQVTSRIIEAYREIMRIQL